MRTVEKTFMGLHLTVIILTALVSTYTSFVGFYDITPPEYLQQIARLMAKPIAFKPLALYASVAGTDTGYGFYAPNVKSEAMVLLEVEGNTFEPKLNSHEGNHMFNVLVGSMTNQIIEDAGKIAKSEKESSTEAKLNELILKNIGIYAIAKAGYQDCKEFKIHYCILDYPLLADAALGHTEPTIIKAKTLQIFR
jgi:hypothetical protein